MIEILSTFGLAYDSFDRILVKQSASYAACEDSEKMLLMLEKAIGTFSIKNDIISNQQKSESLCTSQIQEKEILTRINANIDAAIPKIKDCYIIIYQRYKISYYIYLYYKAKHEYLLEKSRKMLNTFAQDEMVLSNLQQEKALLNEELSSIESNDVKIVASLSVHKTNKNNLNSSIRKLESSINKHNAVIKELNNNENDLQSKIKNIKKKVNFHVNM